MDFNPINWIVSSLIYQLVYGFTLVIMVLKNMTDIVMMFEVHQPYRLDRSMYRKLIEKTLSNRFELKDLEDIILDNSLNSLVIKRVSDKCYIPSTRIIIDNIKRFKNTGREFKVSYSISGVFIEQALKWKPEVIDLFREAGDTGNVEFINQTYYHSMVAFMPYYGFEELAEQIDEHRKLIKEYFNYEPVTVENTEFSYNNDIACFMHKMGYRVILTEGVDWVLGWRSPNYVYKAWGCDICVLTRNYRLSDDIGFRFSDRKWDQYPLTADKYAAWLSATPGDLIFIAIDYETFGEHHWPETGIHEFLKWLPVEVLKYGHLEFSTPREVVEKHTPRDIYDVPPWSTISWADERDLSAWLGNHMQSHVFQMLVDLRPYVKALNEPELTRLWKLLTISDHLYYIATKFGSIEEVHTYFSPYKNPILAYGLLVEAIGILAKTIAEYVSSNRNNVIKKLVVPSDKAFYFKTPEGEYTGFSARSIGELIEILDKVPVESFIYHFNRGDFENWLSTVFFLENAVIEIRDLKKQTLSYSEIINKMKSILKRILEQ